MDVVRRRQMLIATGALMAAPFTASAQLRERVYRIGYIVMATPDEQEALSKAPDKGLWELGYVEGRNIVLERRFAGGKQERWPDLAAELVRPTVDVIVTEAIPASATRRTCSSVKTLLH